MKRFFLIKMLHIVYLNSKDRFLLNSFFISAVWLLIHRRELEHIWSSSHSFPLKRLKPPYELWFPIQSYNLRVWFSAPSLYKLNSKDECVSKSDVLVFQHLSEDICSTARQPVSAELPFWPVLHPSDLNQRVSSQRSSASAKSVLPPPIWTARFPPLPPLIRPAPLLSWLPQFSPNWGVQAEEERGRLLAALPWTLSVARQPAGCCGSGVQRVTEERGMCTHTPLLHRNNTLCSWWGRWEGEETRRVETPSSVKIHLGANCSSAASILTNEVI